MSLDVNTPKGQEASEREDEAVAAVLKVRPELTYIKTPKQGPDASAVIDGFFCKAGITINVAEVKARDMTLEQLSGPYNWEWLVTHEKILNMRTICDLLKLPGFGFLYLWPVRWLLIKQIVSKQGFITTPIRIADTETQRTCNGGLIVRTNAFIPMHDAQKIKVP